MSWKITWYFSEIPSGNFLQLSHYCGHYTKVDLWAIYTMYVYVCVSMCKRMYMLQLIYDNANNLHLYNESRINLQFYFLSNSRNIQILVLC